MKKSLFAVALALVGASFAHADDNYYVCYNQDATSKEPANVLLMATSQGAAGLMNGANVNPPRALFQAENVAGGQPLDTPSGQTGIGFGAVQWQGKHDGFNDFSSLNAYFDAKTGAMVSARFVYAEGFVTYANCVVDSDN